MSFFAVHVGIAQWYTTFARWVFPLLALVLLIKVIRSLLQAENPAEIWATLRFPDGKEVPLTHWENVLGRAKSADVIIPYGTVSRNHGTLVRNEEGVGIIMIWVPKAVPLSTEKLLRKKRRFLLWIP